MSDSCDPMDYSLPGSSVHGVTQVRILEWAAVSSSRASSQPRDWTCISCVSCIAGEFYLLSHQGSPTHIPSTTSQYNHLPLQITGTSGNLVWTMKVLISCCLFFMTAASKCFSPFLERVEWQSLPWLFESVWVLVFRSRKHLCGLPSP